LASIEVKEDESASLSPAEEKEKGKKEKKA